MKTMTRAAAISQGYIIHDGEPSCGVKPGILNESSVVAVPTQHEEELIELLQAIRARLAGEFDHPALMKRGSLDHTETDIRNWIAEVLNHENQNG